MTERDDRRHPGRWLLASVLAMLVPNFAVSAESVTLRSLLAEMVDRERLARLPQPQFTLQQASSTDPASVSPAEPASWFSHNDWSHFLRTERRAGRTERVMLDAAGPGAIVRFWIAGPTPPGKLRIYFDDSDKPTFEMATFDLVGGSGLVGPPLSAVRARGHNLYLPIPYARRCKITYDGPSYWETKSLEHRLWYNINYRTYSVGTQVETLTLVQLAKVREKIAAVGQALDTAPAGDPSQQLRVRQSLPAGQSIRLSAKGPGAVRRLAVRVAAGDLNEAARAIVLRMTFDDQQTVWCPVGDFFGCGVGVRPWQGWCRRVSADGLMECYWVMPHQQSCEIALDNIGRRPVDVELRLAVGPWTWDAQSMYFHATWRQQDPIRTRPLLDWNFVKVQGRGVYVGDSLAVYNPSPIWWGRGDEKVWVDDPPRPTHFGTGTEDYYGYAYGEPTVFSAPFHAQPRAEGPGNSGHVTNTRERSLDTIPFERSLRFDLEIFHKIDTKVAYAATTYWYARPRATSNLRPDPQGARVHGGPAK